MRQREICLLLVVSILCFGVVLLYDVRQVWGAASPEIYRERLLGGYVVDNDRCIQGKSFRAANGNNDIYMNGVLLPADKEGILYLSQDNSDDWIGELAARDSKSYICILYDAILANKKEAIRSGRELTLWNVGEDSYTEYRLVITGLPVMELEEEYKMKPEEVDFNEDPDAYTFDFVDVSYGQFKLFNPGVNTSKYEIVESNVKYHVKGGITKAFDKKGYSISLLDHAGEKLDISLLGMREDHSWKLNALFTDRNRIREKSAIDLWNCFAEHSPEICEAGAKAEYVELIIKGKYMGVYLLVEPVDEKKLELDKNDILYKATGEVVPTEEEFQEAVDNEWKYEISFRIMYPDEPENYEKVWLPIRDYADLYFRDSKSETAELLQHIDEGNIIDNYMFLMVLAANDNSLKNNYYAARVDMLGNYVMYRIPWDLDYTFGNYFSLKSRNHTAFNPDPTVHGVVEYTPKNILEYGMKEYPILLAEYPDVAGGDLLKRWENYRNDFLGDERVIEIFQNNCDTLRESGAYIREQKRWPEEEISEDIQDMLKYEIQRLHWLDEYFSEMCR